MKITLNAVPRGLKLYKALQLKLPGLKMSCGLIGTDDNGQVQV